MIAESTFMRILTKDDKLSPTEKMEFKTICRFFEQDLDANLSQSALDLSKKYVDIPFDSWKLFLEYPPIKRMVKEIVNDSLTKQAEQDLRSGKGTRDALAVRKAMKEETTVESNIRFIVTRLPAKKENMDE